MTMWVLACEVDRASWRKSSLSGGSGNQCVELALVSAGGAVRDSKNSAGPVLLFEGNSFGAFLSSVKTGRLDDVR